MGERMLRPFYFNVVVWGSRFCDYLTDYCIPSLLSDNNIPALSNAHKENKFLICCPTHDWNNLIQSRSFKRLSEYLDIIHIEISCPNEGVSNCDHMGVGHKKATVRSFQDKAYFVALTPDLMLSDGAIEATEKYAKQGKHIVYCAAIRFVEEGVFKDLVELGYDPKLNPPSKIQLSGKELTTLALRNLHDETLLYNLDLPYLYPGAPSFYKVINDEGILLHTLSWCPLLLDHGIIKNHDTSTFDQGTFDSDYAYKNFGNSDHVYVCQDSDEMVMLSWGLKDMCKGLLASQPMTSRSWIRKIHYNTFMKKVFYNPLHDELKKRLFVLPVYFHCKDMKSKQWKRQEKYFNLILHKHYLRCKNKKVFRTRKIEELVILAYFNFSQFCYKKYHELFNADIYFFNVLLRYMIPAIGGDQAAITYLKSHAKFGILFRALLFFR